MNNDLLGVIVNQVIGAVIGVVVSFITSWYFYKKSDIPTQVIQQKLEMMTLMFIQDRLGISLDNSERPSEKELPTDPDVPHIIGFWFSNKTVKQGESITILFRVIDEGLNHPWGNVEVKESTTMLLFPTIPQGYGYYSTRIDFPDESIPGHHEITFKLTDLKEKTHTQSVTVEVVRNGKYKRKK